MILQDLSNAIGVSGDEGAVRKIIRPAIEPHVTDIDIDAMGNLTAFKKGTGETNVRVLLAAHMDEIGFMVVGHESSGLIQFTNVGGIDARILPGLRVKVGKKQLPGVILWPPIHRNQEQNTKQIKDLRIDIGVTSKGSAEEKAKRGDRIAFDTTFREMGDMLKGKAFDDRAGCAVLVEILQGGPYPVDIVAAFTVQEEIGLRGARVLSRRFNPDVAFALEGSPANDIPDPLADPDDPSVPNPGCRLGGGPVITVMDASMITPPQLVRLLTDTAKTESIPSQYKTALGGGTDAGAIHTANGGVPSAVVSVPCRYIHSPAALLRKEDFDNTVKLMKSVLGRLTRENIAAL
jgi:putative aminopeptidase FrvX